MDFQEFCAPPKRFRPMVRWWWPGLHVNKEELISDLKDMDKMGFGGAEIQAFLIGCSIRDSELVHRFAPNPYYYKMLEAVLTEAEKLDLFIDLTISSSWPPGGTWIQKEDALKTLLMGTKIVKVKATNKGMKFSDKSPDTGDFAREKDADGGQAEWRGGKQWQGKRTGMLSIRIPPFKLNTFYKHQGLMKKFMGDIFSDFNPDEFKPVAVMAIKPIKKSEKVHFIFPRATPLDHATAIDLTSLVSADGTLIWEDAPAGTWQIFSFYGGPAGMTPLSDSKSEPGLDSWVIDMLNRDSVEKLLDGHLGPVLDKLKPFIGTRLRAVFTDSQEIANEWYWTTDFFDEFKRRRGYDVRPYLPACFVPNRDNQFLYVIFMNTKPCFDFPGGIGERIRHDWEQTVSDLFCERYCMGVSEWGQKHGGIKHRIQTYGIRVDLLRAYGCADIPETEQLFAGGILDFLKLAGSAGIIYDKPLVTSESLVWMSRDYLTTPLKWKVGVDRLFVAGINQVIYHGFPYGPDVPWKEFPGYYPWSPPDFSSNLNKNNPFWQFFPVLNGYVTRCQYLLQQGRTSCNIAMYYPLFNYDHKYLVNEELGGGYLPGYDEPKLSGPVIWFLRRCSNKIDRFTRDFQVLGHQLMARGYFYTHVNDDVIEKTQVDKDSEKALMGQARVKVLILPNIDKIPLSTAEKLVELANRGIHIIFYNKIPDAQPGFKNHEKNDKKVRQLLSGIKENTRKNIHFLDSRMDISFFIQETLHVEPDLLLDTPSDCIYYIHKVNDDTGNDIYFLRSASQDKIDARVGFKLTEIENKIPVILDPWTGDANRLSDFELNLDENRITISIVFPPYGSKIIAFIQDHVAASLPEIQHPDMGELRRTIALKHWDLVVNKRNNNGTEEKIVLSLKKLKDWRKIKRLKYCNGPAFYKTTVMIDDKYLDPSWRILLDLGKVHDTAIIRVNGQLVATILVPPYETEITSMVRSGANTLSIKVTCTLRNLLVGYGRENIKNNAWRHYKRRSLMPAGIIGPANIYFMKVEKI
ncbi:MAG: glycosyl hydrolase [Promethearchaeota archaeon]